MNDALFPVVEEMGRLNEHNFDQVMSNEITISDMAKDVAFNVSQSGYFFDISDMAVDTDIETQWAANTLFRVPQDNRWTTIWPDRLSTEFTSKDGGMFRVVVGGQWGSESITPGPPTSISSYLIFGLKVDGGIIPDSIIGDQDYAQSHDRMERGMAAQIGSFLIDFVVYLEPGNHTIEVAVNNTFLKDQARRTPLTSSPGVDAYVGAAEMFIWEMHR